MIKKREEEHEGKRESKKEKDDKSERKREGIMIREIEKG